MSRTLMQAPTTWPWPVVLHYVIDGNGQTLVDNNDVSSLLGNGFLVVNTALPAASTPLSGAELVQIVQNNSIRSAPASAFGGGGGGSVLTATATFTANQIRNFGTSPVQIIAAPGAGKVIIPLYVVFRYTLGTVLFAGAVESEKLFFAGVIGSSILTSPDFGHGSMAESGLITELSQGDRSNLALMFGGNDLKAGAIVTSTKGAGGAGYAPGDTGTVIDDSGDALYIIDTVDGGGAVLTYHFSDTGTGYIIGNGKATSILTGGGDGNFTINVTAVTLGDGTAGLTIGYVIATVP